MSHSMVEDDLLVVIPRHHLHHVVTHDHSEGGVNGGGHISAPEVHRHQRLVANSQDTLQFKQG